jgi:rhodanese-related sulfurtransferase
MKSAFSQCLAIAALAVVAGAAYNTVNPKSEKRLPWLAKQYKGMDYLPEEKGKEKKTEPGDSVATAPPKVAGQSEAPGKTGAGVGAGKEAGTQAATRPDVAAAQAPEQALEGVPFIDLKLTTEEFNSETLFIDARKPEEYEAGHIPGARSMFAHAGDLTDKIAQLHEEYPAEAPIVVYCGNSKECEDSKLVANQLKQVGFMNLKIFQGGFPEWREKKPNQIATGKEPGKKGGEP